MNQDNFRTPDSIYNKLVDFWFKGVPSLDVCATNVLVSKCKNWIDPTYDSLKEDTSWYNPNGLAFCNPPHSKTKDFILKAVEQRFNTRTIFLIPLNSLSANYIHENLDHIQYHALKGRIRFLTEEGKPSKHTSRNGYCTVLIS